MLEALGYEWLPKTIVYACAQLGVGITVVRWLARAGLPAPPRMDRRVDRWFALTAPAIASVLLVAVLVRGWVHTAAAFGASDALDLENIHIVLLESRWGERWRVQLYTALALLVAALIARVRPAGWLAFAAAALAVTAAIPLLGHASGVTLRYVVHVGHVLASGLWLGSLAVITMLVLRSRSGAGPVPADDVARVIARFSPLALTAAAVVVMTGSVAAWWYVGSMDALISTRYGRTLLVKLALVSGVFVGGWSNWRRVRIGARPARSAMLLETGCALLVVIASGVLSETEHP